MNVRPNTLDEIIGQEQAKKQLKISLEACKINKTVYRHCLLSGPFGTGKTTFAEAISNELEKPIEVVNGSNLRNIKTLLPCLARIKLGSVLFCDEIHKVSPLIQTYLLSVLEQFKYTLGSDKDSITLELPEFTFIGATTNIGPLLPPLVNRFTYHYKLQPYSLEELASIIFIASKKLGVDIEQKYCKMVALTCRGTPRTAINRLQWIKDCATASHTKTINGVNILEWLKLGGVGPDGLDADDIKYITKLKSLQPAGINTMASATNIDREMIEKTIEPFLIQKGLIKKTGKGRVLV
jgi:Holliday junction DNA helicase RuvB